MTTMLIRTIQELSSRFGEPFSVHHFKDAWKGVGAIYRISSSELSFILKHYDWAEAQKWGESDQAVERKVTSFLNEWFWYTELNMSSRASDFPGLIYQQKADAEMILVLENIEQAGFEVRSSWDAGAVEYILSWLAELHVRNLNTEHVSRGGYWHLETRQSEWGSMAEGMHKTNAEQWNQQLVEAKHQTIIHGDSKLLNYGVNPSLEKVKGFDLQYMGRGVGVQDVACLLSGLGGMFAENELEDLEEYYFTTLGVKLELQFPEKAQDVVKEWRQLLPVAWLDYQRFLMGWQMGHWKLEGYIRKYERAFLKSS